MMVVPRAILQLKPGSWSPPLLAGRLAPIAAAAGRRVVVAVFTATVATAVRWRRGAACMAACNEE